MTLTVSQVAALARLAESPRCFQVELEEVGGRKDVGVRASILNERGGLVQTVYLWPTEPGLLEQGRP